MRKFFAVGTLVADRQQFNSTILGLFVAVLLTLQGCSTTPRRLPAVPHNVVSKAEISGMPGVRYVAGSDAPELTVAAFESLKREKAYPAQQGHTITPPAVFLAISGGGDDGAFAAGLLNAWTETGTRPQFKLVTLGGIMFNPPGGRGDLKAMGERLNRTIIHIIAEETVQGYTRDKSLLEKIKRQMRAGRTPMPLDGFERLLLKAKT
ncbi:hypothetical protein B0G81_0178 [Paraburkholderia sp. BL6665CI2N2]|uniref:hypothetical protein n=1 Tax=Paraburkholderia sp. BL6665CI2N2 TaxID=1938806 RepID=UPI0010DFC3E7|nr:hypothetical protein [Paraburkholderia sp. BL6665CI2N2]TDY20032.1 hypothetical protein B0G81_0178 [Paraburkholderia sp. BL6665CI2N2]